MKKIVSKKLSGFSLIEILVVLMIIGLLTAVVAINVLPSQDRARADKALADIRIYEQALELYRLDMFSYPTSDEGLEAIKAYLKKSIPKDPWGNDFIYESPGKEGRGYDLISYGADNAEGGEGTDLDIVSWKNFE